MPRNGKRQTVMSEQVKRVRNFSGIDPESICYWKHEGLNEWYIHFPDRGAGDLMGNLANHTVTENEDGTITVTPSILTWNKVERRHGFLTKGIWEGCADDNRR